MRKHSFTKVFATMLVAMSLFAGMPAAAVAQTQHGIDIAGMDRSVNPGDDFFLYANGTWFNKTEIPNDRTSLGVFQGIASEVARRNASLISDAAQSGTPQGKMVADYYAAYMDE